MAHLGYIKYINVHNILAYAWIDMYTLKSNYH